MVSDPLVSVIVPAFNHERYVSAALSSIVDDEYPHKEIVIIDDGSTDRTADEIQRWLERRLPTDDTAIRFKSRENRGVARTLNELLHLARGEFVTPLASDDVLVSGGIRWRVEHLQRNPRLKAVFGDCVVIDSAGRVTFESGLSDLHSANKARLHASLAEEIICNWSVPGPVLLLRRQEAIDIGGWDERLLIEDWDLYLRLVSRGWLGYLDRTVAAYRLHGANAVSSPRHNRRLAADFRDSAKSSVHAFRGRLRVLLYLRYFWFAVLAKKNAATGGRRVLWMVVEKPIGLAANGPQRWGRRAGSRHGLPGGRAPHAPDLRKQD